MKMETAGEPRDGQATGVEMIGMTMRFGGFTALDSVNLRVAPGSFHALLGENGAGKSTLVKCLLGFYRPSAGQIMIGQRETVIDNPRAAGALGLGMVYQHFTLAPNMTGAENLLLSRAETPAFINWRRTGADLEAFMAGMPFQVDLNRPTHLLAAGEKQKLEIIKQLWLGSRFVVLDEPTSVLTPAEADEVLGLLRALTRRARLTVLMITHKFREVTAFADEVTVLRRGRNAGGGATTRLDVTAMSRMMVGSDELAVDTDANAGVPPPVVAPNRSTPGSPRLQTAALPTAGVRGARPAATPGASPVLDLPDAMASARSGQHRLDLAGMQVHAGEIVGIAGVSGNGQTELLEVIAGQRPLLRGRVEVSGIAFHATRAQMRELRVRIVPEEPMANACAPTLSVAENLAMRSFDVDADGAPRFWLDARAMHDKANALIDAFRIKTGSPASPMNTLSGGNVQRAVLARELDGEVALLVIANPCFGLDFASTAAVRQRLRRAREEGTAILLISEDLDEILELSDRILVMSEGRIAHAVDRRNANRHEIGQHMAGAAA